MVNNQVSSENPYQSPTHGGAEASGSGVRLGHVGLALSLLGFLGVCLAATLSPLAWLAFLCVPGFLISVIGLLKPPRRVAAWGAALGFFGSLHVPTIFLSMFLRPG